MRTTLLCGCLFFVSTVLAWLATMRGRRSVTMEPQRCQGHSKSQRDVRGRRRQNGQKFLSAETCHRTSARDFQGTGNAQSAQRCQTRASHYQAGEGFGFANCARSHCSNYIALLHQLADQTAGSLMRTYVLDETLFTFLLPQAHVSPH